MDRRQFIAHVEGVQGALRRFLVALCCGDSHTADDIAQETLLKAYLASDGLSNTESFKSWIYRIAYNTFLNSKRVVRPTVGYEDAPQMAASDSADDSFRYQSLYAALDRLRPKERTSVLLFYMQGYSVKEVSLITDASEDAVKQHLSRGRRHLRELLGEE